MMRIVDEVDFSDSNSMAAIKQRVKEAGGLDALRELQRHEQERINEKTKKILGEFFGE